MQRQCFFSLSGGTEVVQSTRPQALDDEQISDHLLQRLTDPDDFIGVEDEHGNTLQICRPDGKALLVEVLLLDDRASHEARMSDQDLVEFLERLPARFDPKRLPGLTRRQWPVADGADT